MSGPKENGDEAQVPERLTREDVDLRRVIETNKTVRFCVVSLVIIVGMICVLVGWIQSQQPAWVTVVLSLFGPTGIVFMLVKLYFEVTKRLKNIRIREERLIDPNRSSSELLDNNPDL